MAAPWMGPGVDGKGERKEVEEPTQGNQAREETNYMDGDKRKGRL
jgi:hypothetical protein